MRRTLAACLILLTVLTSPALAAGRRFVIDDVYDCRVLVDEEGVLYTPAGMYRYISEATEGEWPEEQRLFWASRLGIAAEYIDRIEYGEDVLLDAWGNPVTDRRAEFRYFTAVPGGIIGDTGFALRGLLDADGNVLAEPEFAVIRPNGEGGFLATLVTDEDFDRISGSIETVNGFRLVHLDADGSRTDTGLDVYGLGEFSEGLARVCVQVGETAIYEDDFREGFVYARGELAIEPVFREVGEFASGLAMARAESGLWGLIDTDGRWALAPEYDELLYTGDDPVFLACRDSYTTMCLIDSKTLEIVASFSSDYGYSCDEWDYGVPQITPGIFILAESNDTVVVSVEGKELFRVEDAGIKTLGAEFPGAPPVMTPRPQGDGEYLANLRGERISDSYDGLSPHLSKGGELRFIAGNITGDFYDFDFDTLMTCCVIDASGAEILPMAYNYLDYLSDGKYRVAIDGKEGLIDETGAEILPIQYDWLVSLGDGLFEAKLGDTRGLLDIDGNWRISFSDYEVLVD